MACKLSAVAKFYDYAIHDAEVVTYSPVANVRRPKVLTESSTVGLSADELRRLLTVAEADSPRAAGLIGLLTSTGCGSPRPSAPTYVTYGHDRGHRVLRVTRKGGAVGRVPLAPLVIRALDTYLTGRGVGPIFLAGDGISLLGRTTVVYQL